MQEDGVRVLLLAVTELERRRRSWRYRARGHFQLRRLGGYRLIAAFSSFTAREGLKLLHRLSFFTAQIIRLHTRMNLLRPRVRREIAMLADSELFDESWYLQTYPDLAGLKISAAAHYWAHGAAEFRDPCLQFSTSLYLWNHPEVSALNMNPLVHCILNVHEKP